MGLITKLYDWTSPAGQVISSAEVTAEFAQILALVNGGLDQANLAASSVGNTQLAANAVTDVKVAAAAAINATKIGGGTISNTEFGYLSGVTSNIQTQLNGKAGATVLTANRAVISDGSGVVTVSPVTATEVSYLDGVTSSIQTQLNGKAALSHTHPTTDLTGTIASAQIANGAVTPTKSSFFANAGESGKLYWGYVDSGGSHVLPAGWSVTINNPGTSQDYTVVHNLGTTNYIVFGTLEGTPEVDVYPEIGVMTHTRGTNSFDIRANNSSGQRRIADINFFVIRY